MVWVSERAFVSMDTRKTPIRSFYANLLAVRDYYKNKWFPYTMPASEIMDLRTALDNFLADPDVYERHERIAKITRQAVTDMGLELYLNSYSDQ